MISPKPTAVAEEYEPGLKAHVTAEQCMVGLFRDGILWQVAIDGSIRLSRGRATGVLSGSIALQLCFSPWTKPALHWCFATFRIVEADAVKGRVKR